MRAGYGDLEGTVHAGIMSVLNTASLLSKGNYQGTVVVRIRPFIYGIMMRLLSLCMAACQNLDGSDLNVSADKALQ